MPTVESAFGDESLLELSIVVASYNDWLALESCLGSIAPQANGPRFEVVVIDDGSDITAPERIRQWARHFPLTIVEQSHAGFPPLEIAASGRPRARWCCLWMPTAG